MAAPNIQTTVLTDTVLTSTSIIGVVDGDLLVHGNLTVLGTAVETITVTNAINAVTASSATIAATVTGNAQPAITSVGTLTSLTTTGNVSVGTLLGLSSYVKTALPTADDAGDVIYVSNATGLHNTGSLCFSIAAGAASWVDVTTGNVVI